MFVFGCALLIEIIFDIYLNGISIYFIANLNFTGYFRETLIKLPYIKTQLHFEILG